MPQPLLGDKSNIIYADKVAIFSVERDVFVVLIESKHIAQSYRNMFEFLWTHSEEIWLYDSSVASAYYY